MDFDWLNPTFELGEHLSPREVEESFEDPFGLRLLPDSPRFSEKGRYFCLGKSVSGKYLFSVYRSNGRQIRVICSRHMGDPEIYFYDRMTRQMLNP